MNVAIGCVITAVVVFFVTMLRYRRIVARARALAAAATSDAARARQFFTDRLAAVQKTAQLDTAAAEQKYQDFRALVRNEYRQLKEGLAHKLDEVLK